MPTVKPGNKSMEGILQDHNYPSTVDSGAIGSSSANDGKENALPDTNPIPGADGSLPVTTYNKTS